MRRRASWVPMLVGIAASVVTVAACGSGGGSSSSGGSSLTFVGYGSAFQANQQAAWQKPFTAANGTTFVNDGPTDDAKLKIMVDTGNVTWDVVDTGAADAVQYCGKLLQKLDLTKIDKSQFPAGSVTDCGVPGYYYGLTFLYNTKKYGSNPPTTIADFFNTKKFPGTRMLPPEVSTGILEDALLADGVPAAKLYPLDVKRALAKLSTIKSVTTFATTYGQMQQAMVDDQADMVLTVTARAVTSLRAGATYKPVWDKTILSAGDLVIPKGAANSQQAMKFIAFATAPTQSAKFAELANLVPSNLKATPQLDTVGQELSPYAPGHKASVVVENANWWGANLAATEAAYTNWEQG